MNTKVAELTSGSGEAAILKLQDEIKDCKAILKCGVCFDRPKEVCLCFYVVSSFSSFPPNKQIVSPLFSSFWHLPSPTSH